MHLFGYDQMTNTTLDKDPLCKVNEELHPNQKLAYFVLNLKHLLKHDICNLKQIVQETFKKMTLEFQPAKQLLSYKSKQSKYCFNQLHKNCYRPH